MLAPGSEWRSSTTLKKPAGALLTIQPVSTAVFAARPRIADPALHPRLEDGLHLGDALACGPILRSVNVVPTGWRLR
jgi:hypothetical protein